MKRSLFAIGVAAAAGLAGCMVGDQSLTFEDQLTYEQFKDLVYLEPFEDGVFIVNGDTPVIDEKLLYQQWLSMYGGAELIVNTSGGVDTKWNDTQKLNLTYCISNNFAGNKAAVVTAFAGATEQGWETMGNVNFVYVPAQDATCTASNTNVVFDVRPVNVNGQYLARAFFPNQSRSSRNVLIDNSAFQPGLPWSLKNIVAHELGHALGFRHEHTRPESGTCFEDNNWRPLTPYDAASVMHYPQCNGSANTLNFTTRDAEGIAALYGAPGGGPPPPPPVTQTQTWSGSLAQGQFPLLNSGGTAAKAGSTLSVVMTGTGDPDLYVRWNAQPTTGSWNCRPYTAGASETCTMTVPAGTNHFYIGVRGYTASTYSVKATWVAP
jgi:serine protease